jgi:hypothetical protein
MKTDQHQDLAAVFPQIVAGAVSRLKEQLLEHYQQAYPSLSEIIHLVLDEEEANASEMSFFPHLLFPDLVEARIEKLGLPAASIRGEKSLVSRRTRELAIYQPAFALCG